ncbi:efflux RND transporter periplasmic adaptor subunit [Pedobacter cryophilus]|uniref:Efflux RND transporter periplasmic adaptor subunit n=1 Tax=Pedobacter cryophilus TaxID=2571271 RepID=A0A4U1BUG5_9SPHI|nr:efflux RND transporter periplasmic adaptor subunit [Pedobacter cryophilus]TKB96322.1 efflux RND transporter periplasmic adaptor subunit [Pedobacter cryophilus]
MKTKYIIYAAIALLLGYLIYNRLAKGKESASKGMAAGKGGPVPAMNVNGVIVTTQDFSNAVSVSGTLEANEQVQIRSEISGLVRSINFSEGSTVSKGSLLLKIDDRELQAQLRQALTKEKLASEIESRARKLLKSEAISVEEYDNANAELRSLQAQTQLIRAQLSKTEVRAPFSGKIGLRAISNGAYVTPTTEIANLVSINPLKISFSVPEKYTQRVTIGTNITFTVSGTSRVFKAKVYAKEPAIDINTRTLVLKAIAENSDGYLLPGTFANVSLPLENIKNAILIPTEAVIPVLKGKQVYISKNGLAKVVDIESNIRTERDILVSSGLSVGDTVITSGIMAIKPDAPVKVKIN